MPATLEQYRRWSPALQRRYRLRYGAPPPSSQPPASFYDPALDAQGRASERGLEDLRADTQLGGARSFEDYQFGISDVEGQRADSLFDLDRSRSRGVEDVERGFGRSLADILTGRTRGGEDYQRSIAGLRRGYDRLAGQQGEQQRQAGVQRGGAVRRAMRLRGENEAWDRAPIDTSFQRFTADSAQSEGRLREDRGTTLGRLGEDYDVGRARIGAASERSLGRLGVDYGRGITDRATHLGRAEREGVFFGQDLGAQRQFQARAGGWEPPPVQRPLSGAERRRRRRRT